MISVGCNVSNMHLYYLGTAWYSSTFDLVKKNHLGSTLYKN